VASVLLVVNAIEIQVSVSVEVLPARHRWLSRRKVVQVARKVAAVAVQVEVEVAVQAV
jgi:hypothetical protein